MARSRHMPPVRGRDEEGRLKPSLKRNPAMALAFAEAAARDDVHYPLSKWINNALKTQMRRRAV